ncbi:hypothetical protein, variant [Aphanomyces astaci]|uniref:Chloride channel protein n=1 Tax=Aphanomyces astaci TaxID=112090 RepID=W4H2M8_APHAT|nr:hypothetical protein, variant [Aphanomyces astaci]ETV85499.1 hypothetical protein, variant [Aphanomyces astaci]|eukprot:XP_009825517.1 hypothetical protein, variant [Aphanomyces astaci]
MSITGMLDTWRHASSLEEYQREMRSNRRISLTDNISPPTIGRRVWNMCKSLPHSPITWTFLITLGCLSALLGSLMDYWIVMIVSLRQRMVTHLGDDSLGSYLVWIAWTVLCGVLATSCGYFISTNSDGSGIPQMKALLAGQLNASNVLSYAALVARCVGTVLSNASGLSVGKEGPFLHMISIMADKLSGLSVFRPTADNFTYIRAGVACGVTAVFGSPLGGVLFSIEVTSQYYAIKNLWQSVISSSVCVLTFQIISVLKNDVLFTNTKFADFELGWELLGFLLLGVLCGILAATFVRSVQVLERLQTSIFGKLVATRALWQRRYLHVILACFVTGILTFPFHLLRWTDRQLINDMFKDIPLANLPSIAQASASLFPPHLYLLTYLALKFAVTLLPCGGLPLSCGIFTPLFTFGAVVGRLYGEVLRVLVYTGVSPAAYAVVGAACFASAATHTVSTAVIVFELTGQLSHMLPVMLSVLVAYSIGGMSSPSIYDVFAKMAGLNFVCADISASPVLAHKMAHEVMRPIPITLSLHSTYADAVAVLQSVEATKHALYIPICDDHRTLLGAVRRVDLLLVLSRLSERRRANQGGDARDKSKSHLKHYPALSMLSLASRSGPDDAADLLLHDKDLCNQTILFGPPYDVLSYTALPISTYPPQVGYFVPLANVYVLSCVYMWAQVFVVKEGKLVGLLCMDATLNTLHGDDQLPT